MVATRGRTATDFPGYRQNCHHRSISTHWFGYIASISAIVI
ncbi:MAG TPA: hypothetical protein VKE74_19905 [Gemmataceae bacterium]|nr:hypothetical protein [Gemmataceae bacterium]